MDWRYLLTIILAVGFGVATIVLAFKLTKKKKPVWAYSTRHIIGRDAEAPPELKYIFGIREVSDVYKTELIFFNKGNENIRGDLVDVSDINETIAIQFQGAEILRQPIIQKLSKEAINFSVKQVVKGGSNAIELHFKTIGHNDGGIIEIWHTKYDKIVVSGDIPNVGITQLKEFVRQRPEGFYGSVTIPLVFIVSLLGAFVYEITKGASLGDYAGILTLTVIVIALSIYGMPRLFRYRVFPSWSRTSEKIQKQQ